MHPDHFNTKEQMERVLAAWDCRDRTLPVKGEQTIILFPYQGPPVARITVHSRKSTYGKTLYRVQFGDSLVEILSRPEPVRKAPSTGRLL